MKFFKEVPLVGDTVINLSVRQAEAPVTATGRKWKRKAAFKYYDNAVSKLRSDVLSIRKTATYDFKYFKTDRKNLKAPSQQSVLLCSCSQIE